MSDQMRRMYWIWWMREQMLQYQRDYFLAMLSKNGVPDEPQIVLASEVQ